MFGINVEEQLCSFLSCEPWVPQQWYQSSYDRKMAETRAKSLEELLAESKAQTEAILSLLNKLTQSQSSTEVHQPILQESAESGQKQDMETYFWRQQQARGDSSLPSPNTPAAAAESGLRTAVFGEHGQKYPIHSAPFIPFYTTMMPQPGAGMVPSSQMPPMSSDQFTQQYQQQQQWMMNQPHQQALSQLIPPPSRWAPQEVPPPMQAQGHQYSSNANAGSNEVRSLWIGDLQQWMDENYFINCFSHTGEFVSAKVIRNKITDISEGYGFVEFVSNAAAEKILQRYNGILMPHSERNFRLNWATFSVGERRQDDGPEFTVFVGDLAADVNDYTLQETFKSVYHSVKGAVVVTDRTTRHSKGYGFVKFGDENEQMCAMTEMNGMYCSSRPMRVGPAATKKSAGGSPHQNASYQNTPENPGENDSNNTTIFVGGLDSSVTDDGLKQIFGQLGELVHGKIPMGERRGFVQFANGMSAEQALSKLNGTQLGGQSIHLSWGRSPSNKQQLDQAQWNGGGYYGYATYGYAQNPQEHSMYYGGYPGYGGGPALSRKVISSGLSQSETPVEAYPLHLQLIVMPKGDSSTIRISKKETIGELLSRACEIFDLTLGHVRIKDYYGHRKQAVMNDMDKLLDDANIQMDQDILVEVINLGNPMALAGYSNSTQENTTKEISDDENDKEKKEEEGKIDPGSSANLLVSSDVLIFKILNYKSTRKKLCSKPQLCIFLDGMKHNGQARTVFGNRMANTSAASKSTKSGSTSNYNSNLQRVSLLDSIFQVELTCEGKLFNPDKLSAAGARVIPEESINNKLTPNLARQIQDVLALCSGSLPSWCYQMTKTCPFLFPVETRRQFFYSTAFGLSRALYRLQQQQGADGLGIGSEREVRVGRLQRQKENDLQRLDQIGVRKESDILDVFQQRFNLSFQQVVEDSDGDEVKDVESGRPCFPLVSNDAGFLDKELAASRFTGKDQMHMQTMQVWKWRLTVSETLGLLEQMNSQQQCPQYLLRVRVLKKPSVEERMVLWLSNFFILEDKDTLRGRICHGRDFHARPQCWAAKVNLVEAGNHSPSPLNIQLKCPNRWREGTPI